MDVLAKAADFAKAHGDVALVTVIHVSGSTPRHPGAHMLVSADGTLCGSIGGGRVELELVQAAQQTAREQSVQIVRHDLVKDLAMCCGGSMELFVQPYAGCAARITEALERQKERVSGLLETDLQTGAKTWVSTQLTLGRQGGVFRESIAPIPRVVLFGCGHLARAIGPLARSLSFEVIVCDDNATGAIDCDPDWATKVVASFSLRDLEHAVPGLGSHDYLLILSRDHDIDQRIVEECLLRVTDFAYLGLIGSLGKVGRFRKRILAKARITIEQWQQLRAPIGIDILAETPEEIAVSIMAELIALKNKGLRA